MKHCKTRVRWVVAALVPVIAAAAWFFSSYSIFSGRVIPRRADVIDLRGSAISVQKAEALAAEHPGKTVLWDVPLSGGSRPSDAEDLEITALSLSDIPLFSCFPNLKSVDASGCADYEALLALRAACPTLELTAFVSVGGKAVPMDAQRAVLRADTPLEELLDKLPFLPDLYRVSFAGGAVSYETQDALAAAFPGISFRWDVELLGRTASSAAKELSFAGSSLSERDVHTLCENLFRFPSLERIDLTGCGLTGEQIAAVRAASGAAVVYELTLFGKTVSTDAPELDLSGVRMGLSDVAVIEDALGEFPLLEKVVMCDCGISNEDMAALNDRHENVRFVWRVYFSGFSLRTDDTNFIAARVRNDFPIYSNDLEVLKYCPDLQALDLGHKNITHLNFLRYVPHLKYLIIVENDVNDITPIGELQELTYLEMFWTKCEDISPLQNCKALTDLNISYIYCRPAKCLETLVNMPQLERLWYCGNNLDAGQLEELQAALPDTEMYLAPYGEPTGSTWREHPHYFEMRDFFGMYYMPGGTNGVDENGNQIIVTG